MHHSVGMMQLLLHRGANPTQTTSSGNNLIHVLIAKASMEPEEHENSYINTLKWIGKSVDKEMYLSLLLTENGEGLRPLELAAHLGTYWLFQFLFETPQLYITKEVNRYPHKVQYFDITDYIRGSRIDKSPVKIALYLEERKLPCQSTKDVFLQDPMWSWFSAIIAANKPFLIIWFVLRLLWMTVLIAAVNDGIYSYECSIASMNATVACFHWYNIEAIIPGYHTILCLVVSSICTVKLLGDLITIAKHFCSRTGWLNHNLHGKKETCLSFKVYELLFLYCVFEFTTKIMYSYFATNVRTGSITDGIVALGLIWSALFFVQMLPNVDHYVIATQRMLSMFVEFSLVLSLFSLFYSIVMYAEFSISYGFHFGSLRLAMYNSFLLMETVPGMSMDAGVYLLYLTFVLMVSLLLLNVLLAFLLSSYGYVHEHRDLLMLIQRLSVAMVEEDKFVRYLGPLRKWIKRSYLMFEDDRVYVTRTVWASNYGLSD